VSELNKIYATIDAWRNRPIEGEHPYVYLDGIVLKRSWTGARATGRFSASARAPKRTAGASFSNTSKGAGSPACG
jgi:hypothetical protein